MESLTLKNHGLDGSCISRGFCYDGVMGKKGSRYLALLRGINVGGKNLISKEHLKQCFEDLGFDGVRTYIQSGNVLFRSGRSSITRLTKAIQQELSSRFAYNAQAVVLSFDQYASALQKAPKNWGKQNGMKHNALFTLNGLHPRQVLAELPPPKTELETVTTAPGVLFWSASTKGLSRTVMIRVASFPVYQQLTIRNHNTVFKLLELLETL